MSLEHLDMAIALAVVMLAVSLLVTIFVQTISALFGLRGTNLVWGVEQLLLTVYPELGERATTIAQTVLQHPLISDSAISRQTWLRKIPIVGRFVGRMQFANAVRVQEFVGVMDVLAGSATPSMDPKATLEQQMAAIVGNARLKLDHQVQAVASQASAVASRLREDAAKGVDPGAASGVPAATARGAIDVDQLLDRIPAAAQLKLAKDDLQGWFETAMDRVSQRFTLHVRLWTVAFSIAIAFAMHLDTFRLLAQLASNPDARTQIASAAGALQQVAAARMNAQTPAGTAATSTGPHPPQLYQGAMKQALEAAKINVGAPASFTDRQTAVDWLRNTLVTQGRTPDAVEAVVADYQGRVDAGLGSELDRLADQALTVRGVMNDTAFQLIPNPYHPWDISPWWPSHDVRHPANLHFWGILFSAGLLSLGAPFWYSALKNLSALKPIVANKEQSERQALA